MKNFAFSVYTLKLPKIQKKHQEGHCQRDYKCQHKSYSKYYSRKNVLVYQKNTGTHYPVTKYGIGND